MPNYTATEAEGGYVFIFKLHPEGLVLHPEFGPPEQWLGQVYFR